MGESIAYDTDTCAEMSKMSRHPVSIKIDAKNLIGLFIVVYYLCESYSDTKHYCAPPQAVFT